MHKLKCLESTYVHILYTVLVSYSYTTVLVIYLSKIEWRL